MFLIYLNLIKPGAVLVGYYRLMKKREGELTDEERKQRFQLRSQQAMRNWKNVCSKCRWDWWRSGESLSSDDLKFLLRSIAYKTRVECDRLKMVEAAGGDIQDLNAET
jgi:hypothetical protein